MSLDPSLVDEAYAGLASSAKVDALVEQLEELSEEGHRALVFSPVHRRSSSIVRARLEARGHRLRVPRRLDPQPRRAHRLVPRGHGAGVPDLAQGRRLRAHPHRGRLRVRARPVVEPRRRGPGHRPHPPDRPDPPGQRLPDGRRATPSRRRSSPCRSASATCSPGWSTRAPRCRSALTADDLRELLDT